jgi:hypothetical protein
LAHDDRPYDDIEVATFGAQIRVNASTLNGSANQDLPNGAAFEGLQLIDYDELVDRSETLMLLTAEHRLDAYANATGLSDGTVRAEIEISASPVTQAAAAVQEDAETPVIGGSSARARSTMDDSIDIIGRPLLDVTQAPFNSTQSGLGGGGSSSGDRTQLRRPPAELAEFHPRDEIFANGFVECSNVDNQAIHADINGYHVYGVLDD